MLPEKLKFEGSSRTSRLGDVESQWMFELVEAEMHGGGGGVTYRYQ